MLTVLAGVVASDAGFVALVLLVAGLLTLVAAMIGVRLVDWWESRDWNQEGGMRR